MRKFSFFLLLLFFTAASAWAQCNLVCPGDMLITLNPGQCEWPVAYDARTNNCDPDYQIIEGSLAIAPPNASGIFVQSGPLPGARMYHGTSDTVQLVLLQNGTTISSCEFTITVRDWQWPITNLACNDVVQVAVDQFCDGLVTPDMILEGGPYACYDRYDVEIFSYMPANTWGATGDISNPAPLGIWNVGVYDESGNNCWGIIQVVDKIPPTIECQCPVDGLYPAGSVFPGTIAGSFTEDSRVSELSYSCWDFGTNNNVPAQGLHYYDVYPLTPSMTGTYSIEGSDGNKMIIGVFDQPFNPAFSCAGMLGGGGGWNGGSYDEPNFTVYLIAGQTYYIVASDFDSGFTGLYSMSIAGPNGAELSFAKSIYDPRCEYIGCFIPGVEYEFTLPRYSDNCDGEILTWEQTVYKGHDCGTYIVRRDYTVTDGSGNTAECSSEYFFRGMDLANLEWPKNWDDLPNNNPMLECDGDFPLDWNGNPHPDYTGWPVGWDIACEDVEVFYTDQVYTNPPWGSPACGVKILREWTVVDDCTGAIYKHTQIIRITDKKAPDFTPPGNFEVTTKAFVCQADFIIPKLTNLADNCDPNPKYWVTSTAGTIVGDANANGFYDANETWMVVGVPIGVYQLCYHAIDNCDNERVKCIEVTVVDKTPPIPVCEQFKTVSLTHDGIAKVYAQSFDSGSFDNCGPVWFKVLRVNDDFNYDDGCRDLNIDKSNEVSGNTAYFDDEVFFCCDDLGNEVMVTLRVFDRDPGPGAVSPSRMLPGGDLHGHFNDCWNITLVECKIPPLISCPPLTVTCVESLVPSENPRLMPQVAGICEVDLEYNDGPKDDICGGEFTRVWTATACGKTVQCMQRITIVDNQPFDPCTIVFPPDVTTECLTEPVSSHKPTWVQNPCNVVTAEIVREDTFKFVEGACYKIFREWAVIDWCVYKPNTGAEYNVEPIIDATRKIDCREGSGFIQDGYYRYTQILKMIDFTKPVIIVDEACIPSVDCYAYNVKISATATDDCNPFKQFYWTYILRDAITHEVIQYSYNYHPKPATGKSGSLSEKLNKLTKVEVAEMTVIDPLPVGEYYLMWTVDDGCGNVSSKQQLVRVVDKKAPTPLMVDLATAVMENGMVELQARWFDKGGCGDDCVSSYDNCTPSNDLYFTYTPMLPKLWNNPTQWNNYYIVHGFMTFDPVTGNFVNDPGPAYPQFNSGNAHRWYPELRTSSRVWLCDYSYGSEYEIDVNIYVWDKFALDDDCDDNNYDYATVTLRFNHCDSEPQPFVNLIGLVGLENMDMQAKHAEGRFNAKSQAGKYSMQVYANTSYDVSGAKDTDWLNGVTTLDLVMIQKHILGLNTITDPYKLLAADINNSGSISAADLLEGRQVILGIKDRFVNNSWMTVNPQYQFQNPANAAAEAQNARIRKVNVENTSISGINFDVVKVGDLNSSANELESRSAAAVRMLVDNITLKKGQIIEIPVYAENFTDVYGAQFTMNISGLTLEEVNAGELALQASNYNIVNSNLIMSYNDAAGTSIADGSVLFTLKLRSNSDASLMDMLDINDRMLRSEIYVGNDLSILSLELGYRNADAKYALYQNEPNPFVGETVIGFTLASSTEFRITIFDATGRQVWATSGTGIAGYNSVTIAKTDLDANGVLYYRLESDDFTDTRKMIAIK